MLVKQVGIWQKNRLFLSVPSFETRIPMIGERGSCEKMSKSFKENQKLRSVPMQHGEIVAKLKEMQTTLDKAL